MSFTNEQLERYSRHIILKEIGVRGQKKLAASKVLIVGAGGLGAPAAMYLAAAGVGQIGIADADRVELSNLQRQIIHTTRDLGRFKTESAAEKLRAINPDVKVSICSEYVCSRNIRDIIAGYDFVLDGTDNLPAKFLINDACVMADKPFSYAGILRFSGQIMTVIPHKTPCCRCVFQEMPPEGSVPSCREAGVVGALVGVVGSLQALEAVKFLTGAGKLLTGRILNIDALNMDFHTIEIKERRKNCAVCSDHPVITELTDIRRPVCSLRDGEE